MSAYIYLLHFNTSLSHADHYLGCTQHLKQRLTAHAQGSGSKLCRALFNLGIHWRLAALAQCSAQTMRRVERQIKDQHNAARFCPQCTFTPAPLPQARHIDLSLLTFDPCSAALRTAAPTRSVRFTTKDEPHQTSSLFLSLMAAYKEELGFIPAGGDQGLTQLVTKGQIALAYRGETPIGYAAYTIGNDDTVRVHQIAVRDPVQRAYHGTDLLHAIASKHPDKAIEAKVRADLAANAFWLNYGFTKISDHLHETSKQTINLYRKESNEQV